MFPYHPNRTAAVHPVRLMTLALILGLFTSALIGADSAGRGRPSPGLLPPDIDSLAKPLENAATDSVARELWKVLEDHDHNRFDRAIDRWGNLSLPPNCEVWRQLGQAVAHLNSDRLPEAAEHLAIAIREEPENPVTHYFLGVMNLRRAADAKEYADAIHFRGTRLVSVHVPAEQVKSKSRFELDAFNDLRWAIEDADQVDLHKPLVPIRWVVTVPHPIADLPTAPTVFDLLKALDAENFVGKAHGLLSELSVQSGDPDKAEHHLDRASESGVSLSQEYRTIGKLFEEQGRAADAFRCYVKAVKGAGGYVEGMRFPESDWEWIE